MADIGKIKRAALVAFCVVSVPLLLYLAHLVYVFIILGMSWDGFIAGTLIPVSIVLVALSASLALLRSIRKEETPFNLKNVKRLKVIAVMLILLEPYTYIFQRIWWHFNPLIIVDEYGEHSMTAIMNQFGAVIAAGLVIYCVALVFQYGISLQNQADETL